MRDWSQGKPRLYDRQAHFRHNLPAAFKRARPFFISKYNVGYCGFHYMYLHDFTFWLCAFFLLGVFFISIFQNLAAVILITAILFLYFIVLKKWHFAFLVWLILAGAFYYQVFDYFQGKAAIVAFNQETEVTGVIEKVEQSATKQDLVVKLKSPAGGRVKINSQRYPDFEYGDLVKITGVIKKPLPASENYYKKEGLSGLVNFPKIEILKKGQGNAIKDALLNLKQNTVGTFKKVLPVEKAAFLAGITLGAREEFSEELQNKMSLSGTTHLVALSGYNISVIAMALGGLFGYFLSRRVSFYLTLLAIIFFVLMTGAEASIIRAAIMGIIGLLAKQTERIYGLRNAIVIAAFLMVTFNPRVLVFDLGFQLSFAALLGIIFLVPIFQKCFGAEPGILKWKENTITTVSAQLAVIPLILGNFGIFSLTSFFANILILSFIPLTMALGFIMGGLGLISGFLASTAGLAVNFLLSYELLIINLFSKFILPIAAESFGFFAATIYYLVLISLIYFLNLKLR